MIENNDIKIVILCEDGLSARITYNSLYTLFDVRQIIVEKPPSKLRMLKRRIKRIGFPKAMGQALFIIYNKLFLRNIAFKKNVRLIASYGLDSTILPLEITTNVNSINDEKTIAMLQYYNPDVIVVIGTRIISKKVLSCVNTHFVNTHMGITPKYRGVHGAYWALVNKDYENVGVTVHLIDEGIDTGGILYQGTIHPDETDNFNTYPIHQIAKAIPLLRKAITDIANGNHRVYDVKLPSYLWYHPTIFEYIIYRLRYGVK